MIIAFWSCIPGQSSVTSSMIAVTIKMVLDYNLRCGMLQMHYNLNNLCDPFFDLAQESVAEYMKGIGIDALNRNAKSGVTAAQAVINSGAAFLNEKLHVFPTTVKNDRRLFESEQLQVLDTLMQSVNEAFDVTMIDVPAGGGSYSKEIVQQADLIVVTLNQASWVHRHFFEHYKLNPNKVFYLFGNYDKNLAVSQPNVIRQYSANLNKRNTAVIPHCVDFVNALNTHTILRFFQKNQDCNKQNVNYGFMNEVSIASKKMMRLIGMDTRSKF